jgi:peptide/nickel transport system permease protein
MKLGIKLQPLTLFALSLLALILGVILFAPLIAPQNPHDLLSISIMDNMLPPLSRSSQLLHLLGTDEQGRDVFSALLYGLRLSLMVGISATVTSLIIGGTLGLLAAWFGGRLDNFIMRLVDLQLSFPPILLALILLAVLGKGVDKVVIALISVQWAYYARTLRASALSERGKDYMIAAQAQGLPLWRLLFKHLLPNAFPPLLVVAIVQFAHAISLEAVLSFLGVGVPVTEPSLGLLIANGFQYVLSHHYWVSFFPGAALLLTLFALNLCGEELRLALNPQEASSC